MGARRTAVAIAAALLALAGCAENPVTGERELRLVSEREEIALGEQQYQPTLQSMGGPYNTDPQLVEYVRQVGQRVAAESDRPGLPYEFTVLNDSTPNAWALPGGKIAVNRGLLREMESEAELAAVLGHEVVHSAARHSAQRLERGMLMQAGVAALGVATRGRDWQALVVAGAGVGMQLVSQRYSRAAEHEADRYGTRYMARAGYDPRAAVSLQEKFVALAEGGERGWLEGLFASHPPSQERVERNRELAERLLAEHEGEALRVGEARYAERIAPLERHREAYAAYDEGRRRLAEGEAEAALQRAEEAVARRPAESAFHALRGASLAELGRKAEAAQALDRAIELNGRYFAPHLRRGLLAQEQGQAETARRHLERANALLPTAPAHWGLGVLAEQRGAREAAVEHFRIAAESESDYGRRAREALARLRG